MSVQTHIRGQSSIFILSTLLPRHPGRLLAPRRNAPSSAFKWRLQASRLRPCLARLACAALRRACFFFTPLYQCGNLSTQFSLSNGYLVEMIQLELAHGSCPILQRLTGWDAPSELRVLPSKPVRGLEEEHMEKNT
eukprot:263147-Chlamydomonas_euryale.AAC.4